ncbi:MAG TPA: STAS domain-containing protein [Candidatus Limnocylindria bacterium]
MTFNARQGLGRDMERIDCDMAWLRRADLAVVDLVARLLLAARRGDCELRIVNPPDGLEELLALSGLDRLPRLRVEVVRQAEEREEALGVQEEGDPADPIA